MSENQSERWLRFERRDFCFAISFRLSPTKKKWVVHEAAPLGAWHLKEYSVAGDSVSIRKFFESIGCCCSAVVTALPFLDFGSTEPTILDDRHDDRIVTSAPEFCRWPLRYIRIERTRIENEPTRLNQRVVVRLMHALAHRRHLHERFRLAASRSEARSFLSACP